MSEYTKGPWHFDGWGINGPDGTRLAVVQHQQFGPEGGDNLPRFAADSRLIAAAPILLAALERAYSLLVPWTIAHKKFDLAYIRQAIDLGNGAERTTEENHADKHAY